MHLLANWTVQCSLQSLMYYNGRDNKMLICRLMDGSKAGAFIRSIEFPSFSHSVSVSQFPHLSPLLLGNGPLAQALPRHVFLVRYNLTLPALGSDLFFAIRDVYQ